MTLLLGCIADDLTGASDLAGLLVRAGLRVVQCLGAPRPEDLPADLDAAVVALKTRSVPAREAVEASLSALDALRRAGAEHVYFKYCSTFDSTVRGNIGPVAEALMAALGTRRTVFCPAFPENGRTVYAGHLFVHGRPLHESGMERHPLNPMTDADLVRVLRRQSTRPTGLLPHAVVARGPAAIREALDAHEADLVVADALNDRDLEQLGEALRSEPLVTGGSALAYGLARAWRRNAVPSLPRPPRVGGHEAVLSGSRSDATRRQVDHFRRAFPSLGLQAESLLRDASAARSAVDWATAKLSSGPVLVYSEGPAGGPEAAAAMERALAEVARGLVATGVRRLVVAGGETSGAVTGALGLRLLRIGPEIEPGVSWMESLHGPPLALALKSGNFGTDRFFEKALELLR